MSIDVFMIVRYLMCNGCDNIETLRKMSMSYDPTSYRMFLFSAWSNTPNNNKTFFKYHFKKNKDEETYEDLMLKKYAKKFKIPTSDYEKIKPILLTHLRNNRTRWLTYFGIEEKKIWKSFGVDYKEFKKGLKFAESKKGLQKWGF